MKERSSPLFRSVIQFSTFVALDRCESRMSVSNLFLHCISVAPFAQHFTPFAGKRFFYIVHTGWKMTREGRCYFALTFHMGCVLLSFSASHYGHCPRVVFLGLIWRRIVANGFGYIRATRHRMLGLLGASLARQLNGDRSGAWLLLLLVLVKNHKLNRREPRGLQSE